jgi:NAD+ kinase
MKVLVIRKPTNLEQHGDFIRQQVGKRSDHFDLLETAHSEHYQCLEVLRKELAAQHINFVEISRSDRRPQEVYDTVITVGGDGTLLTSSHDMGEPPMPIIGIRSSQASVGYLCAGDIRHVPELVKQLASGRVQYLTRHRLKARIKRADDASELLTFPVLNDFLFANANPASTTRYRLQLGDVQERHKSSGIWIATATGSTAATSAAGGERLDPEDPRFQFVVRELYQGEDTHQLSKGFFEPSHDPLVIENYCSRAILALDGERGMQRLRFGDIVTFLKADPIRIARALDRV